MYSMIRFGKGFIWGAACVIGVLLTGWDLAVGGLTLLVGLWDALRLWALANLGFSLLPFGVVLVLFTQQLAALKAELQPRLPAQRVPLQQLVEREHWLDLLTGVFVGVGVIWTAIGMRSALLAALGDLDAHSAQALGAFELLRRLVDGGILLALSTTIVGGIGGYVMKLAKSVTVGAELKQAYFCYQQHQQDELVGLLEQLVRQTQQPATAPIPPAAPSTATDTGQVRPVVQHA